jgi:thiol-disulfide isomerase/thioredoxin
LKPKQSSIANSYSYRIALLLLLSFISSNTFAKIKDNVFIDGYVEGFDKMDKSVYLDKSISVDYYNALGESERVTGNFDKQGKFKLSFHLLNPQDIMIQSGVGDYTMTLVKPGEAVHLVMRYYKIDQASQHYPNIHYRTDFKGAFTGPNAKRYSSFWGFYMKAGDLGLLKEDSTLIDGGVEKLNNKLAKITGILKEHFSTADSITTEWLTNLLASEYAYNFILQSQDKHIAADYSKINYAKSTAQHWRFFSMVKSIDIPQMVENDFRRTATIKNPYLKLDDNDVRLLDKIFAGTALGLDSLRALSIGEQFKANPKAIESADSIYCILASDYYAKNFPPFIADIKNGQLVKDFHVAAFFNQLRPKLFENISPEMQDYLTAEILKDNKLNKNITYTKSTEADVVKMLTAKFPGQNLYVDLWATWCGPCRAEFPYYPQVMEKYKDKVTFVFLCGASEEDAYKAVLNNLNFKANHFFLSKEQYANYRNAFGITGIPHYLFITKDGKITNNFKRPSAGNELYALIDGEIGR